MFFREVSRNQLIMNTPPRLVFVFDSQNLSEERVTANIPSHITQPRQQSIDARYTTLYSIDFLDGVVQSDQASNQLSRRTTLRDYLVNVLKVREEKSQDSALTTPLERVSNVWVGLFLSFGPTTRFKTCTKSCHRRNAVCCHAMSTYPSPPNGGAPKPASYSLQRSGGY